MKNPDVIIVGGGVMGCASALYLSRAGLSCVVLEKSVPGAEASSAAAGMLAPAVESHDSFALTIGLASQALHATLARELHDAHGIDVGFRVCGAIRLGDTDELHRRARFLGEVPVTCEFVDDARTLEPKLAPSAGLLLPDEAQLEPKLLLKALAIAASAAGANFRSGATVREVIVKGGEVRGVRVSADGGEETIHAGHVVVAAGSWTSLVPGLSLSADLIHPIRGQMVAATSRPPAFTRLIFGAGGYVLTRPDGRLLLGSTEERVGFARGVTVAGLRNILTMAHAISPALDEVTVTDHWSNFRPGTPDDRPLVGALGPRGLVLASGHYRNGILLAPLTATWITELVTNNVAPPSEVSPLRFQETSA